jgi:hypothetical protein
MKKDVSTYLVIFIDSDEFLKSNETIHTQRTWCGHGFHLLWVVGCLVLIYSHHFF